MKSPVWIIRLSVFFALLISQLDADEIKLTSAGPIAFGPNGLLLVSDPMDATIYAIETGDTEGSATTAKIKVENIRGKVASLMGTSPDDIRIKDLAINPTNGRPYLSVIRGSGKEEFPAIVTVEPGSNQIAEFVLKGKKFTKTTLPNPAVDQKSRRGSQRMQSITDMAFIDDKVFVAGLSNEEFASNLRAIYYPFSKSEEAGSSIEIYHGAHGKYETRSPIRTFAALKIDGEVNLLAAYTCTPLVRIPVKNLKPKSKVKGTTIAELGNRNRPLDMVVYKKGDKEFALMANSSRGVMKIDLTKAGQQEAISDRVARGEVAGIKYETIKELQGVIQLDGLNDTHAVILAKNDSGEHLETIALP